MSAWVSVLGLLIGAALLVFARSLGAATWETQGEPYGFGSARAFQLTYAGVGLVVCVGCAASLVGVAAPSPEGLLVLGFGANLCLRSRTLGIGAAVKAGHEERTEDFQRGTFATGIAMILFSPVVAFQL